MQGDRLLSKLLKFSDRYRLAVDRPWFEPADLRGWMIVIMLLMITVSVAANVFLSGTSSLLAGDQRLIWLFLETCPRFQPTMPRIFCNMPPPSTGARHTRM